MYPLKFEPILKQTLWGGDKIIEFKHLNESLSNVGESWEISAVENNESVVANGLDKGLTLSEMVRKYRGDLVGEANYARFGSKFPLLIKFIDAKLDLSIQVHPGDELAKKRHNSFGKNEMWYVVSADKGAKLISGFSQQITSKEYKERVYDGTFADVLQSSEVQEGDVFYVPAGRVHAPKNGGFYFQILLPPYGKYKRKYVRITPAKYFGILYNGGNEQYYGKSYIPELSTVYGYESSFNPYFIKSELLNY